MPGPTLNTDLLPEPSTTISTDGYTLRLWGFTGVDLTELRRIIERENAVYETLLRACQGVFFLLLENRKTQEHLFWVDRFAAKKIFLYQHGNTLYLTDFIFKLNGLPVFEPILDRVSVALYLNYGYIPTTATLYRSVHSMGPYCYYKLSGGAPIEVKYNEMQWHEEEITPGEAHRQIAERLEDSFIALTRGFDRFLIPLSGGRDSRYLLGLALKHYNPNQISAFTMGQAGTYDFEIGCRLARRLGLKLHSLQFRPRTHFENVVEPATYYKNGLINHAVQTPGPFFESVLGADTGVLILSGYIGDLVLASSHTKPMEENEAVGRIPKPNHFGVAELEQHLSSEDRERYREGLRRLARIAIGDRGDRQTENWYYLVHCPFFTNVCMFSDSNSYQFVLPFVENKLLEYVTRVPARVRSHPDFYENILRQDDSIYNLFRYPLKNLRGRAYGLGTAKNTFFRVKHRALSLRNRGHAMVNYLYFPAVYDNERLRAAAKSVDNYDLPSMHDDRNLSFADKTLLLSLDLNLRYFFQ